MRVIDLDTKKPTVIGVRKKRNAGIEIIRFTPDGIQVKGNALDLWEVADLFDGPVTLLGESDISNARKVVWREFRRHASYTLLQETFL